MISHVFVGITKLEFDIKRVLRKQAEKPTAHLVFADTKANAEKPKELFFFTNARRKET